MSKQGLWKHKRKRPPRKHLDEPRKRAPFWVFVAVVALLSYSAIWLGGKTWALVWRYYHPADRFIRVK